MGHGLCLVLLPFQRCLKSCLVNKGKYTSYGGIVQTNTVYTSPKNETATNILINNDESTSLTSLLYVTLYFRFLSSFSSRNRSSSCNKYHRLAKNGTLVNFSPNCCKTSRFKSQQASIHPPLHHFAN